MIKKSMHPFLLLILLTGFVCLHSFAQQAEDLNGLKPAQLKNFGRNASRVGDIYSAINYYEKYCELKPDNHKIIVKLADLYRKARDYKKALELYEKCYKAAPEDFPLTLYYLALMQKMNGDYVKAKENFTKYAKDNRKAKDAESKIFRKLTANEIAGCDMAPGLIDQPLKVVVTHLDTSINKAHVEFSPYPLNDSTLLYASLKQEGLNYYHSTGDSSDKMPVRQLYVAKKKNDEWQGGTRFPGPFNLEDVQTGNGTYSPNGKRFYFTRCAPNWKGKNICAIYVSNFVDGAWKTPEKLNEQINNPNYTSTQPTVGMESKYNYEVLYFISDREGGKGGTDIWLTIYDAKKKMYKAPQNAGPKINTVGDELTPFFDMETKTMYFSSTGWPGLGGLDIFKCIGEAKSWTVPVNAGYPLNSSVDDIYGVVNKNQEGGFFVSNREGGISLKSATCCDDIYGYKYIKYIHLAASGLIFESDDSTATRLMEEYSAKAQKIILAGDSYTAGTRVKEDFPVTEKITAKTNTVVSLYLIDEDKNEVFIRSDTTNDKGRYSMKLEQGNNYKLVVNSPGYLNKKINISTKNSTVSDTINSNIGITKIPKGPVILRNIYYPFDKASLTDEAKANVDTSIFVLLTENPQITVEISSHTDNKGGDDYNLKLSQKRAESVVSYLIAKGIDKKRLSAKGYGETKPIAPDSHPDGSDNPDGRQMNRRTEMRVTGVLETNSEVIYKE